MSRAVWSGSARAPWVPYVAIAAAVIALVFVVLWAVSGEPTWPGAVAALLVLVVTLPFRWITVTLDRQELVVRYAGPIAPTHRIARKDIESIAVVDLRPLKWGGWGYRGSRLLFRRAAILVRRGPGIEIVTRNGRSLSISVDDPEGAVSALGS